MEVEDRSNIVLTMAASNILSSCSTLNEAVSCIAVECCYYNFAKTTY